MANPIEFTSNLIDRLEALDKELNAWSLMTRQKLLYRLASLNLKETARLKGSIKLVKSLRHKLRKRNGEIESIGFTFARHGIFLEHGVGKGRPIGSSKAAQYKKLWLKPVLEPSVEDLADLLEKQYSDILAAEVKINIPGVLTSKVS